MIRKKDVLIVDPVLILQTAMKYGLSRLGYTVDVASDEAVGLKKATSIPYQFIIIDIGEEKKLDGFELINKIKHQSLVNKKTPFFAISVHSIPGYKEKAHSLGVDGYFEGPYLLQIAKEINSIMEQDMDNSIHILIVEDSPVAQKAMTMQMTRLGCTVETAEDGKNALEKTLKTKYDLILMDIGLGDGPDGFEVTSLIRQHSDLNHDTPIMAVTAHGEPEYREKAIEYGIVDYFTKPLTSESAQRVIEAFKKLF